MSVLPDAARLVSWSPDQRELCSCVVTSSRADCGEVVLLRVLGEVDLSSVGVVEDAITAVRRGPAVHLVVDLAGVTFCGLRGLALMVRTAAAATACGVGFSVCGASAQSVAVWSILWSAAEQPTRHPDAATAMLATGMLAGTRRTSVLAEHGLDVA